MICTLNGAGRYLKPFRAADKRSTSRVSLLIGSAARCSLSSMFCICFSWRGMSTHSELNTSTLVNRVASGGGVRLISFLFRWERIQNILTLSKAKARRTLGQLFRPSCFCIHSYKSRQDVGRPRSRIRILNTGKRFHHNRNKMYW